MAGYFKGDKAKRRVISMRVTDARHAELTRAAAENNRSLSQEIELRLERSFRAMRRSRASTRD